MLNHAQHLWEHLSEVSIVRCHSMKSLKLWTLLYRTRKDIGYFPQWIAFSRIFRTGYVNRWWNILSMQDWDESFIHVVCFMLEMKFKQFSQLKINLLWYFVNLIRRTSSEIWDCLNLFSVWDWACFITNNLQKSHGKQCIVGSTY